MVGGTSSGGFLAGVLLCDWRIGPGVSLVYSTTTPDGDTSSEGDEDRMQGILTSWARPVLESWITDLQPSKAERFFYEEREPYALAMFLPPGDPLGGGLACELTFDRVGTGGDACALATCRGEIIGNAVLITLPDM